MPASSTNNRNSNSKTPIAEKGNRMFKGNEIRLTDNGISLRLFSISNLELINLNEKIFQNKNKNSFFNKNK